MNRSNFLHRLVIGLTLALAFVTPALPAVEMHMVPVLTTEVARGEIIRNEILVLQEMKRSPAGVGYITNSASIAGLAAKRPLRAGVPLRSTDLMQPRLVAKGDLVMIAFEAPGLSLSARGKALEDGIHGQSVRVLNTQTGRIIDGTVTSAGYVLVSPLIRHEPANPQTSQLEYSVSPAIGPAP